MMVEGLFGLEPEFDVASRRAAVLLPNLVGGGGDFIMTTGCLLAGFLHISRPSLFRFNCCFEPLPKVPRKPMPRKWFIPFLPIRPEADYCSPNLGKDATFFACYGCLTSRSPRARHK